jgi:hypothetical protein
LPGERTILWPVPRRPGGFVTFASFAEWQKVILGFPIGLRD